MSKAEPMDAERRALLYTERIAPDGTTAYRNMTPAQRRRWTRKAHREFSWPVTGKGWPTPRRKDAIAAQRARRA